MRIDFVDVSVYQGDIDWPAMTCPAVIKATEGSTFTDPKFTQNQTGARATGKCLGFYHFLSSQSPGDKQANHFLDTVQPLPDELLCLDWETDSTGVRPEPEQAEQWIATVRARGHGNIRLYGNEWLAPYAHQWEVPFWCAWYGNAEQQVRDRNAVAWQWSSSEFVPGIGGRVDVNQVLDEEGWYAMALSDEDVKRIAVAVWEHAITKGTQTEPARQWVLFPLDELQRPDLLQARLVAALPGGGAGGPLQVTLTGTATP